LILPVTNFTSVRVTMIRVVASRAAFRGASIFRVEPAGRFSLSASPFRDAAQPHRRRFQPS
jgi:hypothetical protein